jgi:DNA-binding NarL/FixJ family response regulator
MNARPPPAVHLYSANAELLTHWRHGLAGHNRLYAHAHWQAPADDDSVSLIDLHLPGLPPVTSPEPWAEGCPPRLIACSLLPHDDEGVAVLRAGFRGYCNGWISVDLLPRLVAAVAAGELWIGRSLLSRLLMSVAIQPVPASLSSAWRRGLTEREQEVACLVADGASNKEVARQLGVTERTVKDHLSHIFVKLQVHDRVQLALHVHGVEARPHD